MKEGLVTLLKGEPSISQYCGSRVYGSAHAPQGTVKPHIVLTQMKTNEFKQLDQTGPLRAVTFDIDCKASRSVEASAMGDAVRDFIKDYTGAAGNQTILAVLLESETTDYEPPIDGSDQGTYVVTLDVMIQYRPV